MKKILLGLALTAAANIGCTADSNKLHVKMNTKTVGDTIVVLSPENPDNRQTFTGKGGVFEFDIDVPTVTTIYLVEPQMFRGLPGQQYVIPAVPGEEAVLTAENAERYDIDGSTFYAQYHEADLTIEEAGKEQGAFMQKLQEMMANGVPRDSVMRLYQAGIEPLQQKVEDAITGFIKAHPDYEASAAIIPQLQDVDKMKAAVALLSPAVRDGRCKPLYQNAIDEIEAQQKAEDEAAKKQAAGIEAPDFTLNDLNGKPLSLSSLRGKYVIIDFWGSWCGWCIKGFPEMKEYYKKYAGKFEILGVDCNDTEAKWKAAVEKHELPWLHVYNPRDSKVLEQYGIQGFPTKIIVGPDGKIVKTIVGEDHAFYTLLDELFGR
ncbi:MAG: TlpA family protein disulfide reductase [Prevotella sp.]|nr:TlpA family protein disulfide reductase [Prevotella sp.]